MARRNKWFLSKLWLVVDKEEAAKIFSKVGLSTTQGDVLLARFWDNVPLKSIDGMSVWEQRMYLPAWDRWIKNWCVANSYIFSEEELSMLGL